MNFLHLNITVWTLNGYLLTALRLAMFSTLQRPQLQGRACKRVEKYFASVQPLSKFVDPKSVGHKKNLTKMVMYYAVNFVHFLKLCHDFFIF